jgi:hypothetical protein
MTAGRAPVSGKQCWVGSDLRNSEEWIRRLSAVEIAEIDDAVADVRERGIELADIRKECFPLPSLGPVLKDLSDEVQRGRGFVLLRGLPVDERPIESVAAAYLGIGSHLGTPVSQNAKGHLLGHVRDLGLSSKSPDTRLYQTTERQNFHTDTCDIVALLCLQTARSGGLSSLVSSMTLYNVMAERRPELLERLCTPLAIDRRGEVPEGKKPYYEMPVFNEHRSLLSVYYTRPYIQSAQRFLEARRLEPIDVEALDYFDTLANDSNLRLDMQLERGDIQFVSNYTILHDRTAFEDWPEPERKRHLLRLWITTPDGRPLPKAYEDVYGSVAVGERGGIICRDTRLHVPLSPA